MFILQTHPVFLHLGKLTIYTHALFFTLGALVSVFILTYLAKKYHYFRENISQAAAIVFIVGLCSARLGFFITYPSTFKSILNVLEIWQGGLISYWGILGGLLAAAYVFKQEKGSFLKWLDLIIIAGLFGWGIGLLGNFMAGDSEGVRSLFWFDFYQRVPIQLFESLSCWLIGFYLAWFYPKQQQRGQTAFLGILAYLATRFFIDIWRNETKIAFLHLSQVADLSLFLLLFMAYRFYFKNAQKIS